MEKCFVIQPFDKDKFDRRYQDIFEPAIKAADLHPYRVDKDPAVRIPIEDIEKNISDSSICFAEITTDNPNVWYELGFAFACEKDVVMVCSDERLTKFPFDIQHRHVIKYSTASKSDYETLENAITEKIRAFIKKTSTIKRLNKVPPVKESDGLDSHEIAMLIVIMENQLTPEEEFSVYQLKDQMNKAGYTDIATSMGVRTLRARNLIQTFSAEDWNGNQYIACGLTDNGETWLLNNTEKIKFRDEPKTTVDPDDLPF